MSSKKSSQNVSLFQCFGDCILQLDPLPSLLEIVKALCQFLVLQYWKPNRLTDYKCRLLLIANTVEENFPTVNDPAALEVQKWHLKLLITRSCGCTRGKQRTPRQQRACWCHCVTCFVVHTCCQSACGLVWKWWWNVHCVLCKFKMYKNTPKKRANANHLHVGQHVTCIDRSLNQDLNQDAPKVFFLYHYF